jgi:hypothetical protein
VSAAAESNGSDGGGGGRNLSSRYLVIFLISYTLNPSYLSSQIPLRFPPPSTTATSKEDEEQEEEEEIHGKGVEVEEDKVDRCYSTSPVMWRE